MAAAKKHVFVINCLGQSAHRKGPFKDAEAARAWVKKHYNYPCWLVPAEYVGNMPAVVLDEAGQPTSGE